MNQIKADLGTQEDSALRHHALAFKVSEKFGQPVESVLDTMNEIRNPLGGMKEAMHHIDALGSAMVVLRAPDTKHGGSSATDIYAMVKSAEMRNVIGDKDFDEAIDAITRVANATDDRVSPTQTMAQWKMLKAALPGLSNDFLFTNAPELAQEFQGSPSGTYLSSLFQQIVAGQQRVKGLKILDALGEIDHDKLKPDDFDKKGNIKSSEPGANRFGAMFRDNPRNYINHLLGELDDHGYKSQGDKLDAISVLFGNKNAAWISDVLGLQGLRIDRGAAGIKMTLPNEAAAKELLANDPGTEMREAGNAFGNLMASAGSILVDPVTNAMKDATLAMNSVADATRGDWSSPFWNPYSRANAAPASLEDDAAAKHALSVAGYRGVSSNSNGPDLAAEMHREGNRGGVALKALAAALPPPQVQVDTKVDVKVTLDGNSIAAAVEKRIVTTNRAVSGASDHDNAASWAPPDMSGP